MTVVWFDEQYVWSKPSDPAGWGGSGWSTLQKAVHPKSITCRYCGAEPGEGCTKWRRTKNGKHRRPRPDFHHDRKYDARLATVALKALTSR